MATSTWLPGVLGLLGALIGAGAVLIGQLQHRRAEAKSKLLNDLHAAICDVLVLSQAVDLRAHNSTLLATQAGSLPGMTLRAIGVLAPVDLAATLANLSSTAEDLIRAGARLDLIADRETVELSDQVVTSAMEIVAAHHQPVSGRFSNSVRVVFVGRHAVDVERIRAGRAQLVVAHRALVSHSRIKIGN